LVVVVRKQRIVDIVDVFGYTAVMVENRRPNAYPFGRCVVDDDSGRNRRQEFDDRSMQAAAAVVQAGRAGFAAASAVRRSGGFVFGGFIFGGRLRLMLADLA
jgi:hypothetical protein